VYFGALLNEITGPFALIRPSLPEPPFLVLSSLLEEQGDSFCFLVSANVGASKKNNACS
jgi:hypothetical protein